MVKLFDAIQDWFDAASDFNNADPEYRQRDLRQEAAECFERELANVIDERVRKAIKDLSKT